MAKGSMRRRGDSWELRIYAGVDPATGKERRMSKTFRGTKREAETALNRWVAEVEAGGNDGPDGATLTYLLDQWVQTKKRNWSPKSLIETEGAIKRWIAPPPDSERYPWTPGRLKLTDITPAKLNAWHNQLLEHLAPSTVQRIHGMVHAALETAVKWDWITRNPAARVEPIQGGPAEIVPPTPDELARMLEQIATDPQMMLMFRLAATLGRRRGELCAIRWTDIDFDESTVSVSRTFVDSGNGWVERPITKNRTRFPALAVGESSIEQLRQWRELQIENMQKLGVEPQPDDLVFLTLGRNATSLTPWTPSAVTRRFARHRDSAGVANVRFHDLRHHVATTLIDKGVPLPTIAARLGHGSGGRTTQEVYGHRVPATDRAAADALDALLDALG